MNSTDNEQESLVDSQVRQWRDEIAQREEWIENATGMPRPSPTPVRIEGEDTCRLPASGFTETPLAVFSWADNVAKLVRAKLGQGDIKAYLWAYRHGGKEHLACDLMGATSNNPLYDLTFELGRSHDFDPHNPDVPDMADAMHMVGILIAGLDATITIGRRGNEVNAQILAKPLAAGETSGEMAVAGATAS